MRVAYAVVIALATLPLTSVAESLQWSSQAEAIEYARSLVVRDLDPRLPALRLDEWLPETLGEKQLRWFLSDCDLKGNSREHPEDSLLCVGAAAGEGNPFYLRFHLVVGNWWNGVVGMPQVLPQSFVSCNPTVSAAIDMTSFEQLGDLPGIVDRLWDVCPATMMRPHNNELQRTRPAQAKEPRR